MASTTVELEMFKPGTKSWLDSKVDFSNSTIRFLDTDARHFYRVAKELIEHKAWELYFDDEPKTWERLLQEAIGVEDLAETLSVIQGVELALRSGVVGPIPASLALSITKRTQQALADKEREQRKLGKVGNPTGNNQYSEVERKGSDSYNSRLDRGADYLLDRIERDFPETYQDVKAGKFRSTRQAAISVGIVKPSDQWTAPGPVGKLAAAILKRYSSQQISQLKELLP